ncbi:tetratricopeptide repeat protein [Desulfolutivibrio sulfoxidireducens]|uniref:tetratricopeptide repeat protein n=1 Tax=Desulfolutivibrio sulfoxidireducens TaxID=2773299 RepID=UPI00159E080A|nr:tetratricopeptide repeat protein [Desulfolutivibrio sulfoxidireducens]QLA17762.1 tetratricopeptide repeat protein [Desulfolutivibrio sulfoxidireducens]QLA21338.1 tetratricopeptide repeat protein [Desulfolutivibrio sulfoxidireducens]
MGDAESRALPETGASPATSPPESIKGVFSTQTKGVVGFGATKRKVKQNIYVFVEEQPDGSLLLRELNRNFVPVGKAKSVSRDTLLADYLPEPDVYLKKVVPGMRRIEESVDKGDDHRAKGELISAEFEYKNALRLDEEHIRGTFGLGLTYLARGEKENADIVFRRVVVLDGAFEEEHKHLFNEFGIRLRKNGMHAQALKFYKRATRLARHDDEHLLYNIARTFYEKGQEKQARRLLEKALGVNPDFTRARGFLDILDQGGTGPDGSLKGIEALDDLDLEDPDFTGLGL